MTLATRIAIIEPTPVREVFEIPAGYCRDIWAGGACPRCSHLDERDANPRCHVVEDTDLVRVLEWHGLPLPCRRTDGKCVFPPGPIRLTMEAGDATDAT